MRILCWSSLIVLTCVACTPESASPPTTDPVPTANADQPQEVEDINAPQNKPLPGVRSTSPIPDWAQSIVLPVQGMTCGGCEQAINEALEKQEGIFRSEASHLNGHVKVHYDAQKVKPAVMVNTVNALGYRANSSKPDPDIKPVEQKDAKDLKGHEMVGKKKLSSPGKAPAPQQNP